MTYLKKRTRNESVKLMGQLAREIQKLGGPLTKQLYNLFRDRRYLDLVEFSFDYSWVFSSDDFIYARQIQALVAKQDFLDLGVDKEAVAFAKFLESEDRCQQTNIRLERNDSVNTDVNSVCYAAMRKISDILGECPTVGSLDLSFGPGATTSTKSLLASPRAKLSSRLECSANLLPGLQELLQEVPKLCEATRGTYFSEERWRVPVTIAPGKLEFVPKTSLTHRAIVVEPILNGLGQKGIGKRLKCLLKRHGCDLSSQLRNQNLARKGSIDGTLATIDLSSASDCISRMLVWSLLPYDWACLLDMYRSECVVYNGVTYDLEKFSSMGNAYTFELESLIFYSLALSVCQYLKIDQSNVSVYGDDIIIPVEAYDLLKDVLEYCGFSLNEKKSFKLGPFRESCGVDYLNGIDIRPFYLKTLIDDRTLYCMHNFFFRNGDFLFAKLVKRFTHKPSRIYGPDGYGDGHLLGNYTLRLSRKQKRDGFCGGVFDTYTLTPRSFKKPMRGDYIFPCYSIYVRGQRTSEIEVSTPSEPYRVRGICGYSKISIYTHATTIFGGYSVSIAEVNLTLEEKH